MSGIQAGFILKKKKKFSYPKIEAEKPLPASSLTDTAVGRSQVPRCGQGRGGGVSALPHASLLRQRDDFKGERQCGGEQDA